MKQVRYEVMFDHIDNMRLDDLLAFLTDDVTFTVANQPTVAGKEGVRAAIGGFWRAIAGLKHHIHHVFNGHDRMVFESVVTYTRHDKNQVDVPCVTVIQVTNGRVNDWRIYLDATPVFAPA